MGYLSLDQFVVMSFINPWGEPSCYHGLLPTSVCSKELCSSWMKLAKLFPVQGYCSNVSCKGVVLRRGRGESPSNDQHLEIFCRVPRAACGANPSLYRDSVPINPFGNLLVTVLMRATRAYNCRFALGYLGPFVVLMPISSGAKIRLVPSRGPSFPS